MAAKREAGICLLPLSRIKTIMKSSPDVTNIGLEALFLTGKATEMFVETLAQITVKASKNSAEVSYNDLAEIVNSDEVFQFLQDIIPKTIKASQYMKSHGMLEGAAPEDSDSDSDVIILS